MITIKIPDGTMSIARIHFNCPHCNKQYADTNEVYLNRCNRNQNGCARIRCTCGHLFYMTYNMCGDAVSFNPHEPQINQTSL